LDAIEIADLVLMGPGSLYTSILPNLLIKDIRDAVLRSDAYKVFIMNAMTQPGETTGMSAWDHLNVILDHTDPRIVDACFMNTGVIPAPMLERYAKQGALPVSLDIEKIREKGYRIIQGDVLQKGDQVRHDSELLMKLILEHEQKKAEGQTTLKTRLKKV
jgi:uncharacterized cofD-like protein